MSDEIVCPFKHALWGLDALIRLDSECLRCRIKVHELSSEQVNFEGDVFRRATAETGALFMVTAGRHTDLDHDTNTFV